MRWLLGILTVLLVLAGLHLLLPKREQAPLKLPSQALRELPRQELRDEQADYGHILKGEDARFPDDTLESKHPEYHPGLVKIGLRNCRFHYTNSSDTVIRLDTYTAKDSRTHLTLPVKPSFIEAREAARNAPGSNLASIDMFNGYTSYMDEELLKTAALILHDQDSLFPGGRQGFIREMIRELQRMPRDPARDEGITYLAAAYALGGGDLSGLHGIDLDAVDQEILRFDESPVDSKPIGFYAEDEPLGRVFRHSRYLIQPFGIRSFNPGSTSRYPERNLAAAVRMAEVLDSRPDLLDAYNGYFRLMQRLTCPTSHMGLTGLLQHRQHFNDEPALVESIVETNPGVWQDSSVGNFGVVFLPFSSSKEARLFERLDSRWLGSTRTMDVFTEEILTGKLDLTPDEDSGFYDYQLHALETLLVPSVAPEYNHLLMTGAYKKRLRKAFESILAIKREIHGPLPPPDVPPCDFESEITSPVLSVEPAPTHFLRTARSYAMLGDSLKDNLGDIYPLIRLPDGLLLEDTVEGLIRECYGLYLLSCKNIHLEPSLSAEDINRLQPGDYGELSEFIRQELIRKASGLLASLRSHPSMERDTRIIVPVAVVSDDVTRNWAVLGVRVMGLRASYAQPPRTIAASDITPGIGTEAFIEERIPEHIEQLLNDNVDRAIDALDSGCRDFEYWSDEDYTIPVYVFAEIEREGPPLTREEFRAACDAGGTTQEMITRLREL